MVDNFLYIYIYKKVMPYAYRKIRNQNAYKVFNKITGVIHSNHTTLENAKKQIRLLNAIENNPNFKLKKGKGGSEYGTDDELVEIDRNRVRRQQRQKEIDKATQLLIDELNELTAKPNLTVREQIRVGYLERQIVRALRAKGEGGYQVSPPSIIERSVPVPPPPTTPAITQPRQTTPPTPKQEDKRRRTGKGTAGSKEVASITEDAKKRGEELKKRIAEIEKSNVKKADTLKKAELKRIKAELKKIEKEDPDYVGVDIPEINTGKGLPVGDIQKLLKNSYQAKPGDIDNWILDKSLSGKRVQVYKHRNTSQAVVVHRGTQGAKDWATDLYYATGGDPKNTRRFQHAADIQKKAESKYGANNITTLGHSLGAKVASTVGQNSKEIINLNKAVSPLDAVQKTSSKETNIRTSGDPVSALLPVRNTKRVITIPSETYNPFKEHSTDTLNRLPPKQIIGSGSAVSVIRDAFRGKPYVIDGLDRIERATEKHQIIMAVFSMLNRYRDIDPYTEPTPFDLLFDGLSQFTDYDGEIYWEIASRIINDDDFTTDELREMVIDWIDSTPQFRDVVLQNSTPTEAQVVDEEPPIAEAVIEKEGAGLRNIFRRFNYKNKRSVVPFDERMFNEGVEIMPSIGEAEDTFKYNELSIGEISRLIQEQHDRGNYDNLREPLKSIINAFDIKTKRGYGIKRGMGIDDIVNFPEAKRRQLLYYLEYITQDPQYLQLNSGLRLLFLYNGFVDIVRNENYVMDLYKAAIYHFIFLLTSENNIPYNIDVINGFTDKVKIIEQLMIAERGRREDWYYANTNRIIQVFIDILNNPNNFTIPIPTTVSKTPSSQTYTTAKPTNIEPITEAREARTLPETYISPIEPDYADVLDEAGNIVGYREVLPEMYANDANIQYTPPGFFNLKSGEGLAKKKSPNNKKMVGKTNPWVEYVKSFAKGKGINYASAMKHPDLKKGYKKGGMMGEDEEFKKTIREKIVEPPARVATEYMNKEARKELPVKIAELFVEDLNRRYPSEKKVGKGVKVGRVRGRGMPTSRETVIAEAYNENELGANGGKRFVSL
jgi:hypothetical protein